MMNVIVIGATSGIGRAVAEIYLAQGHRVGVTGRRTALLEEFASAAPAGRVFTRTFDVSSGDAAAQLNFLGYDAIAVSDPVVMSVYTRRFSTRDVFIGISRSGRTKLLIDGLKEASAGGAYCAFFSNYVNSPAAAIADAFFCTSRIDDMKSVVGQESNLSMLAAIGALVMVVARLTDRDAL